MRERVLVAGGLVRGNLRRVLLLVVLGHLLLLLAAAHLVLLHLRRLLHAAAVLVARQPHLDVGRQQARLARTPVDASVFFTWCTFTPRARCDSWKPSDATPDWWKEADCLLVFAMSSLHPGFLLVEPAMPRAIKLARCT